MAGRKRVKLTIAPIGAEGLDLFTAPDLVTLGRVVRSENMRYHRLPAERRKGIRRIATLDDDTATNGAMIFGALTKYATVSGAAHQLVPKGGFALLFSLTAVRPAVGPGFYLTTRVAGKAYGPFKVTLTSAGVLTAAWRKESDESEVSISTSALGAGSSARGVLTYDPYTNGGESRLYIEGVENGTAVTAIGANEQPMQDQPDVIFGVDWSGGAVADSFFSGACDTCVLLVLTGRPLTDVAANGRSLLDTILRSSLQDYPNPESAMVRWHYSFDDGAAASALTDHSRYKANGVVTGANTSQAGVSARVVAGQFVGILEKTSGEVVNVVSAGGAAYTETVRKGTT